MKTRILVVFFATGLIAALTMKAQEKEPMDMNHVQKDKVTYTCTMHPEVTSDKQGECSKCGMVLTKKNLYPKTSSIRPKRTKTIKTYVCSMHPDEVSTKSGKCPICGMKFIKEKSTIGNREHKRHKHQ